MMVPFAGVNLHYICPPKDWFIFCHLRVRICIECTFGIFISRWGIFWSDLRCDIPHVLAIVHACVRLHNFCINRRLPVIATHIASPPHAELNEDGILNDEWRNVDNVDELRGRGIPSTLRDSLLEEIIANQHIHARSIVRN